MFVSFIDKCIDKIKKTAEEYDLQLNKGLELFCGDGSLYTAKLAQQVTNLTGLDISREKGHALKKQCDGVNFICVDSIQYVQETVDNSYDIISIDNPLCVFGDGYCEHFEIIDYLPHFVKRDGYTLIVYDYVTTPYDAEVLRNQEWLERRKKYYNCGSYNIDSKYAVRFYKEKFDKCGLNIISMDSVCREKCNDNDYFHMIVCLVEMRK